MSKIPYMEPEDTYKDPDESSRKDESLDYVPNTKQPEKKKEEAAPDKFKYNIGDIIKVSEPFEHLFAPGRGKDYHGNLRVVFRFFDGFHVYIAENEFGIGLIIPEYRIDLVERSTAPNTPPDNAPDTVNSRLIDEDTYKALRRLGILDTSVRSYNRGASDYSKHLIQPWSIWKDYDLNPWDADIVKRVLRHKATDTRKMDYEKIIHICQERIRQIDMED